MTAAEFAGLLRARSVGRGKWVAKCPAHADKRPSLSIAEGKKQPIVFRCMSQGCTQNEVLAAIGLTWKDLMGERPRMNREAMARLSDERYLRDLKELRRFLILDAYHSMPELWSTRSLRADIIDGVPEVTRRIIALENRLNPELEAIRERDAKTVRFVKRWGWDRLWEMYLEKNPTAGSEGISHGTA